MAHFHFHSSCIQRSKGQNAVATAAYIAASKLVYKTIDADSGEEISISYDFTKKKGVVYSKIFVPEGFEDVAWLQDREQLWNAAEAREKREDSTIARGIEFALPREIDKEENIRLVEEFVNKYIVSRGLVCDVNIHYDNPDNPHVHFQFLERRLERLESGVVIFAKRKDGELSRRKFLNHLRHQCAVEINKVYKEAGLNLEVSEKSYKTLGIDQIPTRHKGSAHYMKATELEAKNKEIIAENAKKIYENPEVIFGRISYTKPVFTKEDIAIALSDALMVHLVSKGSDIAKEQEAIRSFGKGLVQEQGSLGSTSQNIANDALGASAESRAENADSSQVKETSNNPAIEHLNKEYGEEFLRLYNQLSLSDKIELMDQKDLTGKTLYALKSRVNLERRYVSAIEELNIKDEHNLDISSTNIDESKSFKERLLGVGSKTPEFSDEQITAILSVCNGSDISVLEGNPGAGKTFVMREIVRQYKAAGFKVVGTGPSSVSAKVLSRNAGIKADNMSLLRKKIVESKGGDFKIDLSSKYYEEEEYLKSIGCDDVFSGSNSAVLDSKTVLIADEASMIELANMDYLADAVLRAKAKLVLVGDNNQFTAVGMTGAFNKARKIAGGVKLTEVRRQERLEYRQATEAMGRFAMQEAIEIYRKLDVFNIKDNEQEAKTSLVTSFAKEYTEQIDHLKRDDLVAIRSIAIGAYTNEKVAEFNTRVRNELKNRGALKGTEVLISSGGKMLPLMKGDQIVFEENSLRYGISSGEVGTILSVKPFGDLKNTSSGEGILKILVHKADGSKDVIEIDTAKDIEDGKRRIKLNHGYALTGYKLQGETVDNMHVYFDRSIGYEAFLVLMSRHRQAVKVHASAKELEELVYQRIDNDVEKVRNQFKINSFTESSKLETPQEVPNWLIGLTLAVSRRANNSFAIDYLSNGTLDGNQLIIKEYLEARSRVFECHGKMREWKSRVELTGNIINLHNNIKRCAESIESIKLDAESPATPFELELNIKDLKIDPYSIALSDGGDSFKYIIASILKGGQESTKDKEIKGVTIGENKLKINFKELDRRDQSKIIASCLRQSELQEVKNLFKELKLEKNVLKDYASVICDSYHSVIDVKETDEFKRLILEKKDESKLITDTKIALRDLVREQNFNKSEDRQAKLEEQIARATEKLAKHEESLNATASKISTNLQLIQEKTTFSSDSVLMGERTIQLNINYETLRKHAGHDTYKYYLQDITRCDTIIHCKAYADLMLLARDTSSEIVKERDNADSKVVDSNQQISKSQKPISTNTNTAKATNKLNRKIQKALASIDSYVFDNKELMEFRKSDLSESKKALSNLKQERELKENFVETLLPHYLGRIYEQSGTDALDVWHKFKALNPNADIQQLANHIQSNPKILGKLHGIGLGTVFGVSSSRRKSIEQVSKLGHQLLKYEENVARLKEITEDDLISEQEQITKAFEKELQNLEHLKPSKLEAKFLSGLKAMQAGSGLNMRSFKSLVESDEVQDLICEYYNSQHEKYTRLNATDEEYAVEYERYSKEQEQQAATHQEEAVKTHSTHQTITHDVSTSINGSKSTNRSNRRKERTKVPALRFDKVQEALTSSDIEKIFKDYAASIRGGAGAIKRSGAEISMGSLSMNLSKGTWIRHSSVQGGNIFGFVAEGASVSRRQALEIVADIAGIRQDTATYEYKTFVAARLKREEEAAEKDARVVNEWTPAQDKITNAESFDPHKHLKGSCQHNTLEAVYTYKDADSKLLGYVVRFVSKEDGKKQTLPVTYCYNAAKDEKAWRLKGFTDKGDKPIFGIEKAQVNSKPILIVEGEKAAIAASKILPDYHVLSWMGGSNAADKVNWGQLKGRDVIIWPDNDEAGFKAAEVIKNKLNKANDHIAFVSVIDPTTLKFNGSVHKDLLPTKWDLADRLPNGMTISNVKEVIENVRAAHLDLNQIQSVIQSANAADAAQQLVERNIWQEVFKGKIVNGEKITALSANEHRAATFFSSEEAGNYVKYLEATGKGGVAHDYLKYDSPMYQDILTSLITRDERLSESIKGLGNNNNTSDISTDTVTLEASTKLIDNAQTLYEKKALEYSGTAGMHSAYRDHLELMVKNYGETHSKVTLYKDIVRDVSILHSAQLGTNIHDLPDRHHEGIAGTIYNNVTNYKALNGRGQSDHKIDNLDKIKIAEDCYAKLCGSNAWSVRAANSVKVASEALSSVNLSRQENAATLLEQEKHKIKDILKLNPKFDQEALKQTLGKVGASEQAEVLNKVWLGEFKAKVLPELDVLKKEKVASKTVNELIGVFKKEKEYCTKIYDAYPSVTNELKTSGTASIQLVATSSNILTNFNRDIEQMKKYGIWNESQMLSKLKSQDSVAAATMVFKECQQYIVKTINRDLATIREGEAVLYEKQKFRDQVDYLEYRLNAQDGLIYASNSDASLILKKLESIIYFV